MKHATLFSLSLSRKMVDFLASSNRNMQTSTVASSHKSICKWGHESDIITERCVIYDYELLNFMWTMQPLRSPTVSAGIIERKLRSTKVRLFTVPCCSIILFSSEGVKKNVSEFTPNFFRRSIILVGALLFYNYVFPHFSHISHFRSIINVSRARSIINVSRAPFYNSCWSAAVL